MIIADVIAVTVAAVVVVVSAFATTGVLVVFVVVIFIATATGAQGTADEREQLLHVSVELIGKARNAAPTAATAATVVVVAAAVIVASVSKHVRLEVYRLGVTLRRQQLL